MLVQPKLVAANTLSSLGIADDEDVGNIKKHKRKEAAVRHGAYALPLLEMGQPGV